MTDHLAALRYWRKNPVAWCRDNLGVELWARQQDIINAVRDNRETAVASCHGAGKSFTAACVALWFLYTHSPSVVITTAPTQRQVRGILWKEIRTLHRDARVDLGGTVLTERIQIDEDWYAWGFTASDYNPDAFQGFHEANILVVADEAAGISEPIFDGIAGVLSSDNARLLLTGNPTSSSGYFYRAFRSPDTARIQISAFDTPNFVSQSITQEDLESGRWLSKACDIPSPKLVTPEWVSGRMLRWGKESALYQAKVLGRFPEGGEYSLIPVAWIESAQERSLQPGEPVELGVDIARYGSSLTVLGKRAGSVYRTHRRLSGVDTMRTAGEVRQAVEDLGASVAKIDICGVGGGVYDRIEEVNQEKSEGERCPIAAMNAGGQPIDRERFINLRGEWYWELRRRFEAGEIDIDPHDDDLASQLAALRWRPDSRGRNIVETKEEMKRRGLASPDDADALMLAFAPVPPEPEVWFD